MFRDREWSDEMGGGGFWTSGHLCCFRAASWCGAATIPQNEPAKVSGTHPAFIDKLIEEGWKKAGVKPAKPASDEEFLRRVYIDLVGRIPNVQEATAFLSMRESDKRGKLIEYLLEHPDFGKNFATQWTMLLDRPGQSGADGGPAARFELAAQAVRRRSALERGRPGAGIGDRFEQGKRGSQLRSGASRV